MSADALGVLDAKPHADLVIAKTSGGHWSPVRWFLR